MVVTKCCGKTTQLKKAWTDDEPSRLVRWRRCGSCGTLYCPLGHAMPLSEVHWAQYGEELNPYRVQQLMKSGEYDRMLETGKLVVHANEGEPLRFEKRGQAPVCLMDGRCFEEASY